MKLYVLLAAVAIVTAEEAPAAKEVVRSAPIAHVPGAPTITGLASTFPTLYTAAHLPLTYTGHSNFIPLVYSSGASNVISPVVYSGTKKIVSPITYSGTSKIVSPIVYSGSNRIVSPLVYTSGTTNAISPAIVPNYFAETEGAQHIVN